MKKNIIIRLFILMTLFAPLTIFAQAEISMGAEEDESTASSFAETITKEDLKKHLSIIAADDMEGRETGTAGQRKAADYIANYFKELNLPTVVNDDSYFQKIVFTRERWTNIEMHVRGKRYRDKWDFYAYPATNSSRPLIKSKHIIFLGYGIDDAKYSDYKGANVKGKVVLIYDGEPMNSEGISYITGTQEMSEWSSNWRKKMEVAYKKGASLVLVIDPNFKQNLRKYTRSIMGNSMRMGEGEQPEGRYANNCFISSVLAKEIIGTNFEKVVAARENIKKGEKSKPVKLKLKFKMTQEKKMTQLIGSNVLGFIEGIDPEKKDEVVVLTAHYDHIGKKGESVYNGADDNGSGTSSVLEIAEALVEAKKAGLGPKRSVLCMLVSGEEKGLLGSEYYSEFPIFPLENTVANVNVDMVGRVDKKHETSGNPNYIYVIGSNRLSTELHEINETANKTYTNLELDYTYNAKNDPNRFYYRSDHYNFAKKGIPAIFYFSGTHKDYHRPSDTIEKINFEKMEQVGKLIFYTTLELANREERIKVDVKE